MLNKLPPRERQIVDLLFERGDMAVSDLCEALPDPLSGSAVRAMLKRLEDKGFVRGRWLPSLHQLRDRRHHRRYLRRPVVFGRLHRHLGNDDDILPQGNRGQGDRLTADQRHQMPFVEIPLASTLQM